MEHSDIRMIELSEQTRLPLETLEALLVLRKLIGKNFVGDVTAELHIPRAINFTHTAGADGLHDFVVGELVTGG